MPLPREILEAIGEDIAKAEAVLADLQDVVSDMRLSGMATEREDAALDKQEDKLRSLKVFYERQKTKSL